MDQYSSTYRLIVLTIVVLLSSSLAQERTKLDDLFRPLLRKIKYVLGHGTRLFTDTSYYRDLLTKQNKAANKISMSTPFPCDLSGKLRSDTVPTSAHQLRPGDIDLVGNIGDSLSAGTGISAVSILQEGYEEERGRSFSGGGEKTWRTYLTLPNILKEFNPKLFGFGLRSSQSIENDSQFNVAENGALSVHIRYMVRELVKRIKNDPRTDINNHWKMITIMIGDNDFCGEICYLNNYYDSLEVHRKDLLYLLRYLRDNLPRTIVNLIPPPRLDILFAMKNIPLDCYMVQVAICACLRGLFYRDKRKIMSELMVKWQQVDLEVADMDEFDLDTFTVIPHMFTTNYTFPRTPTGEVDYGYLAPDCFHFSEKAQARFGNDLWNSLLEPVGKKSTDGRPVFSRFLCPTDRNPYIFTKRNSRN